MNAITIRKHLITNILSRRTIWFGAALGWMLAAVSAALAQPTIQFATSSYTVSEAAASVTLTVQRLNDPSAEVRVDYATTNGTATAGQKYTAVSGTLAFGAGETNKTILVPILNEGFVEGAKSFPVILSNPTGGAVLGARANATVSITENDVGIQFRLASYSVVEDAGAVRIGVVREDDGEVPVTVEVATSDLTATSGLDYTGTTNTISFAPTERVKVFYIPILNNSLKESNKTFRVTLSNPTGGTLGSTKTITVTIVNNDQGFQFESASCTVAEDAGAALISVLRGTDETNFTATVDYATTDGSATSGLDYKATNGILSFAPGEKVKVVAVPILNDGIKEDRKNFQVTLTNPTGGAVLGSRTNVTVSIVDNDPGVGFEHTYYTSAWGDAGGITVTVLRGNDGALGPITVDYATSDATAKAGEDYQAVSGTLTFQENETVKSLTFPILRPRATGGTKSFGVNLSNPTGGATLGTASTTVAIAGAYYTLAPPLDPALTIRRDGGVNILTWSGGGQLQRADQAEGPWQTLGIARSPYTIESPIPAAFYRVTRPRPVNVYVPSSYDGHSPIPLVILLHGYGDSGTGQEAYMQFRPLAENRGFLYCYPDALVNVHGDRGWICFDEASDPTPDFGAPHVDDAGYLRSLIQEVGRNFALDPKRVYLIGHSGGGFMASMMAVSSADLIAGIASLEATLYFDYGRYAPSEPVNILHIHGTADSAALYWGGALTMAAGFWCNVVPYPSAMRTIQIWAGYNGSSGPVTDAAPSLDLTTDVPGLDTVVTRYTNHPPGGAVELWTINGGAHVPTLSSEFSPRVIDWLLAHPKP